MDIVVTEEPDFADKLMQYKLVAIFIHLMAESSEKRRDKLI